MEFRDAELDRLHEERDHLQFRINIMEGEERGAGSRTRAAASGGARHFGAPSAGLTRSMSLPSPKRGLPPGNGSTVRQITRTP